MILYISILGRYRAGIPYPRISCWIGPRALVFRCLYKRRGCVSRYPARYYLIKTVHKGSADHTLLSLTPEPTVVLEDISGCTRCALAERRARIVVGDGDASARVMLIGEAPGAKEDRTGKPFVGAAGRFLNELLDVAGLRREEVYITNVVKCRPPRDRAPQPEEISAGRPLLGRALCEVRPANGTRFRGVACHALTGR